ncbi:MAG: hypothetical protein WKG00_12040 [Polyangiaceae bacterium]
MPAYVAEGPYRPEVLVFCSEEGVLGMHVLGRGGVGGEMVRAHLRATMRKPAVGTPRRPARVRVSSPEMRDALAGVDGVAVVLDATPELDALAEDMFDFMQRTPGRPRPAGSRGASYLGGGALSADRMATFFSTAGRLWRAAPWDIVPSDSHLLGVDVPALGLTGVCVSIIGQAGQSFGLLAFESIAAQRAFVAAGERARAGVASRAIGCRMMAVSFDHAADLPAEMAAEADRHGWVLPGPGLYPSLISMDADGVPRPADADDLTLAIAIAGATAQFFERHTRWTGSQARPVTGRYLVDEAAPGLEVEVTVPYPDPARRAAAAAAYRASPRPATDLAKVRATTDIALSRLCGELWPPELLRRYPDQLDAALELIDAAGSAEDMEEQLGSLPSVWASFWLDLPDGRNGAEVARGWPKLKAPVLAAALARMAAARGLYGEVLSVDLPAGLITVRDLLDGAVYRVSPPPAALDKLTRWARCFTFIVDVGDGTWYVPSTFLASQLFATLPAAEMLREVRVAVCALDLPAGDLDGPTPQLGLTRWAGIAAAVVHQRVQILEAEAAARAAAQLRFLVTSDGERFEPHEAPVRLEARALPKLRRALCAATDFVQVEHHQFSCVDRARTEVYEGGEVIGHVDATSRTLVVSASAPGRWRRLLQRVEALAGAQLEVGVVERVQPWTSARGIAEHEGPGTERATMAVGLRPRSGSPEAGARELTLDTIGRQLDREVPMLGGKPRDLVLGDAGKAVVEAWLREAELRGMPGSGPAFMDLDPLRDELGLPRVSALRPG